MLISPTINNVHGRIFFHTGADPAAGDNWSVTVPARRRWRLLGIRFLLATSVAAANRRVLTRIDDGTTIILHLEPSGIQTASLSIFYNLSNNNIAPFRIGDQDYIPLAPYILPAGSRIRSLVVSIEADDNLSAPLLLIEEWIDP